MNLYLIQYEEDTAFGYIDLTQSRFLAVDFDEPFMFGNGMWGVYVNGDEEPREKLRAYLKGRYIIRKYLNLVQDRPIEGPFDGTRQIMVYPSKIGTKT